MKLSTFLSALLKISASVCLLTLAVACVIASEVLWRLSLATQNAEASIVQSVTQSAILLQDSAVQLPLILDKQLTVANSNINRQLTHVNGTIDASSALLLIQSAQAQKSVDDLSSSLQLVSKDASKLVSSANEVVSNPDIPKLLRDTRETIALTGSTMAHIRSSANSIAEATPDITNSIARVSDSSAAISKDVQKITDEIVAPRPWYKKVWSATMDAAGLARFIP